MKKKNKRLPPAEVIKTIDELPPMTDDEFRERLLRIRDKSLGWLDHCTTTRTPAGSGAAKTVLLCVCDELERLEKRAAQGSQPVDIRINGLRLEDIEFGSNK